MKKLLFILLVSICSNSWAQESKITTFILVRHAKKDLTQSTNDPDLSAVGKARVTKLVELFRSTQIDAIYSTEFKRTRQTVEPLAQDRSIPVMSYQPVVKTDIDLMLQKHVGQTILVSGHSNTVPTMVNYLIGEDKYKTFDDADYGNVIIVSVIERGKNTKVVWMQY